MSTKAERIIDIVNYLSSHGRVTYQTLAYEFGVSVKTIKEYVVSISERYMVTTYMGRYGGIELQKSSVLHYGFIKKDEMDLIITALEAYVLEQDKTQKLIRKLKSK